ncbi:TPA: hypothetical protein N0F65_010190 [Lagenidium giganteum]|uniref:RING-type domain-containing protein n=1 Tax=Lagenidium giganteum TaxID=4803 RepID=A0AAV2Z7P5_9STRA|nr:TPA: hypothetical protein N0F65_010190 [Lagenidium giganteum]
MDSGDEWCLLDNDWAASSGNEAPRQPEPEAEPWMVSTKTIASNSSDCATETEAMSEEDMDVDVAVLLPDGTTTACKLSAQDQLLLLSPEHRRYAETGKTTLEAVRKLAPTQSSIKRAFERQQPQSFVERLRQQMPSRQSSRSVDCTTQVQAFTCEVSVQIGSSTTTLDMSVQTSTTTSDACTQTKDTDLSSLLDQRMTFASQLKDKSHACERLHVENLKLKTQLAASEKTIKRDQFKLSRLMRTLEFTRAQDALSADSQSNLTTELEQLRRENSRLQQHNDQLTGCCSRNALHDMTVDELEALEASLLDGAEAIRTTLRAKYRDAVESQHTPELCIVCQSKPVSVLLLPCRHQVLCSHCALRVTTCPIDRKDIEDKVLTFGLNAYQTP